MKFRKQGPKFLDDMHYLFGKAHVSGSSASCPGDISSDDSSDEDEVPKPVENVENTRKTRKRKGPSTGAEEKDEKSPFLRLYKNTCEKIETAAAKISTSVETSSAPTNPVPTIAMTMKMVKECGVLEGTALMYTATSLIMKPEFREVFSCLETIEGRLDLIKREHDGRQ